MTDSTIEAPATPRLKQQYKDVIVPELEKEFKYSNPMQVARVQKVVVSMGVGAAARDSKLIEGAVKDLTLITGQKPKITKAKKSVAQFHLREGQAIGAYVTLRGDRMWEFLDRLLTLALPRIRDFRGINGKQFDGQGNYNFGLTEQSMFHEIDPDSIDHQRGMDITVVTSTKDDKEASVLLKHLGLPATPRLKQQYKDVIVPELEKEFKYSNPMQVARVQKVVVSMGVGAAARDSKLIEGAVKDLTLITGQKPKITKAKKSVAQFHLREGQAIGAYVTLRGDRMWEFLDRLLTLALPRIRDFRGINGKQFDGQGNYNFGLTEQSMFHEIDPDSIDHQRGMDITVVTSTKDDKEASVLLKHLGFPFKEN